MKFSYNWLKELVDLEGFSVEELCDWLTKAGIEVEDIEVKGINHDSVVVAQIKEAEQHPNADRLKVCQVDAGEGSLRQIVCGATNYQVGDKVPCALPGAVLPGDFTINEGELRGVASRGMLCAAGELGFVDQEDGLMILQGAENKETAHTYEIGQPIRNYFDYEVILDVEITPNRGDLLSHEGLAKELAAVTQRELKIKPVTDVTISENTTQSVEIQAEQVVNAYYALTIEGVNGSVASSDTLASKLQSVGIKTQNALVDVSNYILRAMGQPLHVFDADKISGALILRLAEQGESFVALDEQTYTLRAEDLVIADNNGIQALAGVIGAQATAVSETTKNIVVEMADFDATSVRPSARCLNLSTDASYHFERQIDGTQLDRISQEVINAYQEYFPQLNVAGLNKVKTLTYEPRTIELPQSLLDRTLNGYISMEEAAQVLSDLGLIQQEGGWLIPSSRHDLTRPIDLVEEVIRVIGLDKIQSSRAGSFALRTELDNYHDFVWDLSQQLAAQGCYELQNIKLISEAQLEQILPINSLREGDVIQLKLPLSEDQSILRPSLIPGLLAAAAHNARQGQQSFSFFEHGRVFRHAGGGKARNLESESLGLLLAGHTAQSHWSSDASQLDIFDLKGLIQSILPQTALTFKATDAQKGAIGESALVNYLQIVADKKAIGRVAVLSPSVSRELDLPYPTMVAELDLKKVNTYKQAGINAKAATVNTLPSSSRDISLECLHTLNYAEIEQVISKIQQPLLVNVECLDLFADQTGEKLDADKVALTFRFTYQDAKKTLKAKQVDEVHAQVLKTLTDKLPISIR